jgi:hypothetical protein
VSFADLPGWRSLQLDDVKQWLAETDDVDVIADALRMLIKIMPSGRNRGARDIDEVMRRAERRLAELVRAGQAAGEIGTTSGDGVPRRPRDIIERHVLHYGYVMFDGVSREQFEDAIAQARQFGTISRTAMDDILHDGARRPKMYRGTAVGTKRRVAQISDMAERGLTSHQIAAEIGWNRRYLMEFVRRHKILLVDRSRSTPKSVRVTQIRNLADTGHRAAQIAQMIGIAEERVRRLAAGAGIELSDTRLGSVRTVDANRVLSESTSTLEGIAMAIGLIDTDDLDPERIEGWAASLKDSIRTLQHLHKELTR